jgi:hypothetical protein
MIEETTHLMHMLLQQDLVDKLLLQQPRGAHWYCRNTGAAAAAAAPQT